MTSCNCTFAYWSVVPPTHCPKCGRCLGCGQHAAPPYWLYPYPVYQPYVQPVLPPWSPWSSPNTSITYTTTTSNTTAMQ